ncbi:MAG: hypothetical protein MI922_11960, partial [Bacteroidales bacterium]|nr:hypothetical protein [Bacteroidales bacterium]
WQEPMKADEYKQKEKQYIDLIAEGKKQQAEQLKMEITYDVEQNIPQKKGTISKCVFSADKLRNNQLPSCVSACPNGVFYFGDENEDAVTNGTTKKTHKLSKLLTDNGAYHLMPELGTKPRVYYLPPKNRLFDPPKEEELKSKQQHT